MSTTAQTPTEINEQARQLYRQSVAAEMPLSGKALGNQFGKSDRWGRLRIQECAPETGSGTDSGNPERQAETPPEGGTETTGERNGNGTEDDRSGEEEPETPGGAGGNPEAETRDGNPHAEPDPEPDDQGGGVLDLGSTVPESGTASGSHAAAVPDAPAEPLPPVPVVAPSVPDTAPRHSAVPARVPVSVPGASAVPRAGLRLAWAAFLVGTAASIAANVAHAVPQVGARLAGGFVPLALILAVELMCRPLWRKKGWQWQLARYGGTGLVALVTAVMSYSHMRGLLLKYGETDLNATIGPLAVDGLMIVAGFALLAVNDRREQD